MGKTDQVPKEIHFSSKGRQIPLSRKETFYFSWSNLFSDLTTGQTPLCPNDIITFPNV